MPTTTPFQNLITFSRGSNATVTGPNGLIQWAPSNLLTFSEQFDNAAWGKTNATVAANQNIAGGTLGSELAPAISALVGTNDNFSGSSGSFSNGVWSATCGTDIGYPRLRLTIPGIVIGRRYVITLTATLSGALSSVRARLALGGSANDVGTLTTSGSITGWPIAAETNTVELVPQATASGSFTVTITSISVREVTPAAGIAPDGTWTADTLLEDTTNGAHGVSSPNATVALGPVTWSVYVKAGTRSWVWINAFAGSNNRTWFNLANGTVGTTGAGATASITSVGNDWYRCAVTLTSGTTTVSMGINAASADNTTSYAGTTSAPAILIWGAQLELGSTATTYNPTTVKNLLGFSEAFDNAAWTKGNASIVTGAQANPVNGLFNAQKLMEDTANAQHRIFGSGTAVAGGIYTFSVYVKAAGRSFFSLYPQSGTAASALYNLANGTSANGSVTTNLISHAIQAVGGDWFRCSLTFTATGTTILPHIYLRDSAGAATAPSYTGDGNSGIFLYGAQLSDSASLDPYAPTPGAAPSSTAYYGPRFDYDPVTRLPRGILIEEQRSNLRTYSEQMDNAAWTKDLSSVTANATTSPDGTVNADLWVPTTGTTASVRLLSSATVSSATVYTASVYVKAFGRRWVYFTGPDASSNAYDCWFDLQNGVVGTKGASVTSATITAAGNGWYRLTTTSTSTSTTNYIFVSSPNADNSLAVTANGVDGLYVWGAQLEAGAFATSYIPTIASTVTRSADVATISGSLFLQWYRQDQGTLVLDFSTVMGPAALVGVVFGGGSQAFQARVDGGLARSSIRGVADLISATGPSVSMPGSNKVSYAYLSGSNGISANGGATVTSAVTFTSSGGTLAALGSDGLSSSNYLNGHLRSIRYIPVRSADFQLQALTT